MGAAVLLALAALACRLLSRPGGGSSAFIAGGQRGARQGELLQRRPSAIPGAGRGLSSVTMAARGGGKPKSKLKNVDADRLAKREAAAKAREEAVRKAQEAKAAKEAGGAAPAPAPAPASASPAAPKAAAKPARSPAQYAAEVLQAQGKPIAKRAPTKTAAKPAPKRAAAQADGLPSEEELAMFKVKDLKNFLREKGLKVSGIKTELLARVREYIISQR